MNVNDLLHHYGYVAVFVLVGAESLGVPLPGETILIAAGVYAGATHKLNPWIVFAVAAAAIAIRPPSRLQEPSRRQHRLQLRDQVLRGRVGIPLVQLGVPLRPVPTPPGGLPAATWPTAWSSRPTPQPALRCR